MTMARFIVSTLAQKISCTDGRSAWFTSLDIEHYVKSGRRRYRTAESPLFSNPLSLKHLRYTYRADFSAAPREGREVAAAFYAPQLYIDALKLQFKDPLGSGLGHPLFSMRRELQRILLRDRGPGLHRGSVLPDRREFKRIRFDVWRFERRAVDSEDVSYYGDKAVQNLRFDYLFRLLVKPKHFDRLSNCPLIKLVDQETVERKGRALELDCGPFSIAGHFSPHVE